MVFRKRTKARKKWKAPTFMSKKEAWKRKNEVSTKMFYFKSSGKIGSNVDGIINNQFATQRAQANPQANNLPTIGADFQIISRGYISYRVMQVKLEIFPWAVGSEADKEGISTNPMIRGNACTYISGDMQNQANPPFYNDIALVINKGSAMLIRPRAKHSRIMSRPKTGFDTWGSCDHNVPIQDRINDSWWASIVLLVNDASPSITTLWFWKVTMKVQFRGRSYVPIPNQIPLLCINNCEENEEKDIL